MADEPVPNPDEDEPVPNPDEVEQWRQEFHSEATDAEMEQLWSDAYRSLWLEEREQSDELRVHRDREAVFYLATALGQRDHWIYEQRRKGLTNPQVIEELSKVFVAQYWEHITTDQGIRDAVNRYCLRTGARPLPVNQGGRPRRNNPQGKDPR